MATSRKPAGAAAPQPQQPATPTPSAQAGGQVIFWVATGLPAQALAVALAQAAGHGAVADNPFRVHGELHAVAKGFAGAQVDRTQREAALQEALAAHAALVVPVLPRADDPFHHALVSVASKAGFRHVVLFQRDPVARLCGLAQVKPVETEPQVRDLLTRERNLTLNGTRLRKSLASVQSKRRVVALEDLASGGPAEALGELLRFAGNAPAQVDVVEGLRGRIDRALLACANLPEGVGLRIAREAQWIPDIDTPPAFLKPVVTLHAGEVQPVLTAQVTVQHRPLLSGDTVQVSGLVLADAATADRPLVCVQDGVVQPIEWHQPSPGLQAKMPGVAAAAHARFKPFAVRAQPGADVSLLLGAPGPQAAPVADLRFAPAGRAPIHGIFVSRGSIGYQAIPKAACTSVKEALFRSTCGLPFASELGGGDRYIHDYFYRRSHDISGAAYRFVIVRDPIKRFLSAFGNRVLHFEELSRAYIATQKVAATLDMDRFPFDPTIDEFIERFEFYRCIPTINHHFRPMSEFVASLAAFDRVYRFEEMKELSADMTRRLGAPFVLPHSQRGGPKLDVGAMSRASFDRLLEIYAEDYRMLAGLYAPPAYA